MTIEYYTYNTDLVMDGFVITAATNYEFALKNIVPLIERLDIQRDALNTKFYSRLEDDIINGCVMPPITIALIHSFSMSAIRRKTEIRKFINENIDNAFILDGIQRINTLKRAALREGFNKTRPIHINFIIASSRDRLLYRMITLNNGQKAMSARHQIDVLADSFFNFNDHDIKLVAEKGKGRVRAPDTFNKADFVKGYIAYLSESVNIDNQKIIEEKMDELIAFKIIESNIPKSTVEFADIVTLINKFSSSLFLKEWIRSQNNFIGFCVGAKTSFAALSTIRLKDLEAAIQNFELAFSYVNVRKVNLAKAKRESVANYIKNIKKYLTLSDTELLDKIQDWI